MQTPKSSSTVEWPNLVKCCFCLPLRRSLITWGYVNVILNTVAAVYYLSLLIYKQHFEVKYEVVGTVIAMLLIQIAFSIVLIVGCHKKSAKLLKVSYVYCLVLLTVTLGAGAYSIYIEVRQLLNCCHTYFSYTISGLLHRIFLDVAPILLVIFVQTYVTVLIRSGMVKINQELETKRLKIAEEGDLRKNKGLKGYDVEV